MAHSETDASYPAREEPNARPLPGAYACDLVAAAPSILHQGYPENVERFVRFRGTTSTEWVQLQVIGALGLSPQYPQTMVVDVDSERALAIVFREADETLRGMGTFYVLNEVNPLVRLRAPSSNWNRMGKGTGTTDPDIVSRRAFYLDFDPVRPVKGISASDEESRRAIDVAITCYAKLIVDLGSEDYLGFGFSGNGAQVYLALDSLPADAETTAKIRGLLMAAKFLYRTDTVELDTTVSDAKRLCPAFGTMKRKGANSTERPHRRTWFWCQETVSRLTQAQLDELLALWTSRVTPEQGAAVDKAMGKKPTRAPGARTAHPPSPQVAKSSSVAQGPFADANAVPIEDVADWLCLLQNDHPVCPGCGTTGDTSVAFVGNGLKCLHNRCAQKGKAGFRTVVDLVVEVMGVKPIDAARLALAQFAATSTQGVAASAANGSSGGPQPLPLITNANGHLVTSVANVMTVLTLDTRWAGVVVYDVFREAVIVRRDPPCRPDEAPQRRTSPEWGEQDSTRTASWLLEEYGLNVKSNVVDEAVATVAQTDIVHPVRDYFRSVTWDGTPRLDKMLPNYFGADDNPYTCGVGPRWMISAVARVECPGCQVDCMLVLESAKQGTGKTSGFRTLVPEPSLYNDTGLTIGDKDSYQNLRGVFIYGFDELDSIRRSELTKTKNFISQTRDRYRPPYARRARDFERQNVFCGTTNEEQYLADRTGNRRIWPVHVQRDVDVAAILRDRDQLWAEAFARYNAGEKWHVNTPEFRKACEDQQAERVQADPWETLIAQWLEAPMMPDATPYDASNGVLTVDVLLFAIGMRPEFIKKGDEMRVADILRTLGYVRGAKRKENGTPMRRYVKETTSRWSPNQVVSLGGHPGTPGNQAQKLPGDHLDHLDGPPIDARDSQTNHDRNGRESDSVREVDSGGPGGHPAGVPAGPIAKEASDLFAASGPPSSPTLAGDHLPGAVNQLEATSPTLPGLTRWRAPQQQGASPPLVLRPLVAVSPTISVPTSSCAMRSSTHSSGRNGWTDQAHFSALADQNLEDHLADLDLAHDEPRSQMTAVDVLTAKSSLPFVKWAGGKRKLLSELRTHIPATYGRYFEPFLGAGSLFFDLQPKRSFLSDANPDLIAAWLAVRDNPDELIALLKKYPREQPVGNGEQPPFYGAMRASDPSTMSGVERGARFIYLQGSCHNGIWRVNKKGQHNAPLGRNGSGPICNEPRLRACSAALQGTNIQRADFASVLSQPVAGDLVYLDPPYVPISATSMFTSYTRDGFGTKDQVRLRDIALRLKVRGVHVILSNSSAPAVRELYARGFKIHEVQAARSINCRRDKRGPVTEFVIT